MCSEPTAVNVPLPCNALSFSFLNFVRACMRACVCACLLACLRACVRACAHVRVCHVWMRACLWDGGDVEEEISAAHNDTYKLGDRYWHLALYMDTGAWSQYISVVAPGILYMDSGPWPI